MRPRVFLWTLYHVCQSCFESLRGDTSRAWVLSGPTSAARVRPCMVSRPVWPCAAFGWKASRAWTLGTTPLPCPLLPRPPVHLVCHRVKVTAAPAGWGGSSPWAAAFFLFLLPRGSGLRQESLALPPPLPVGEGPAGLPPWRRGALCPLLCPTLQPSPSTLKGAGVLSGPPHLTSTFSC